MTNIENADEKKISALRVVGLGLVSLGVGAIVGALWKKRHIYTIIEYVDIFNEEQRLVFDFEDNLEEAQQIIYKKMVGSHFRRGNLRRQSSKRKRMKINLILSNNISCHSIPRGE